MTIHLATDHRGYLHKEALKQYLLDNAYEVVDHGAAEIHEDDDYPDFVTPCAQAVAKDAASFGVIFGGSGQGEAMCANRISGIRATAYYGGNTEIIKLSREHNNANILSIGARFIPIPEMLVIVKTWLGEEFSNDPRHIKRLSKF